MLGTCGGRAATFSIVADACISNFVLNIYLSLPAHESVQSELERI